LERARDGSAVVKARTCVTRVRQELDRGVEAEFDRWKYTLPGH
jgi:hypothetical protein